MKDSYNDLITLDEACVLMLHKYQICAKPINKNLTFKFNRCSIEVNEKSTLHSLKKDYYDNVNLDRFLN